MSELADRWRLIRVSTDLLAQFGTRTEDGRAITAEWGEPDADGIYEPVFTVSGDAHECLPSVDELAAVLREVVGFTGPDVLVRQDAAAILTALRNTP